MLLKIVRDLLFAMLPSDVKQFRPEMIFDTRGHDVHEDE